MSRVTDTLSATAFRLQTFYDMTPLGSATGFLYRAEDNSIFLVTNYHVLSGYNPLTQQPIHPRAALPNLIKFAIPSFQQLDGGNSAFKYIHMEERLLDDELRPKWHVHPKLGNLADVVGLRLGEDVEKGWWTINDACRDALFDDEFSLRPGIDVFVIGFPLDLSVARHLALWKRGTIASEPMFDVNDRPIILIDTATRSGMSGSPVIAQIQGIWGGSITDAGKLSPDTMIGTGRQFIGIYSGRLGQDEFQAQLGIVWKRKIVQDIAESGQTLDVKTAAEAAPRH